MRFAHRLRIAAQLTAVLFLLAGTVSAESDTITFRKSTYQDRNHFVVETPSATYWIDRNSGGLSRLVDSEGIDWIQFKMKPWGEYPSSASGAYRGIPNLLFGDEHQESGFGHPGWDRAKTRQINGTTIECTSHSGRWKLRWEFSESDAHLSVRTSLPNSRYWFLYEGPIAGRWSPKNQYFASNTSAPAQALYDYAAGERKADHWRWVYFGDQATDRVLFIAHEQSDQHVDTFSFLGDSKKGIDSDDGMVVFGFGRGPKGIEPLLQGNQSFRLGFLEQRGDNESAYESITQQLNAKLPSDSK